MLNSTIILKIKQRLNKIDSQDYDSIETWTFIEAFNKAQVEWVRRQLHGYNNHKEGDEGSNRRIDDLQILLNTETMSLTKKDKYYQFAIPGNYLQWKRVSIKASQECCSKQDMIVYLVEEDDIDLLLRTKSKQPSFEWRETLCTVKNNNVLVYTNNDFTIDQALFTFYRQPLKIQVLNSTNPYTGVVSTQNVNCEFKDDIVELIIDDAASIIAGDIESMNQYQRNSNNSEKNN